MSWFKGDLWAVAPISPELLEEARDWVATLSLEDRSQQSVFAGGKIAVPVANGVLLDYNMPIALGNFLRSFGEALYRVEISNTPPGKVISEHYDNSHFHAHTARYHIVLTEPTSYTTISRVEYPMLFGVVYRYNNRRLHSASNQTAATRVHLVFETCTKQLLKLYATNPGLWRSVLPLQPHEV
jgi:Aspartyl/Asparaginyl beta-hydroxylase